MPTILSSYLVWYSFILSLLLNWCWSDIFSPFLLYYRSSRSPLFPWRLCWACKGYAYKRRAWINWVIPLPTLVLTPHHLGDWYLLYSVLFYSTLSYNINSWRYDWKIEEAKKNILRTHTTAVSSRMLYKLTQVSKHFQFIVHRLSLQHWYWPTNFFFMFVANTNNNIYRRDSHPRSTSLLIESSVMKQWTQPILQSFIKLKD